MKTQQHQQLNLGRWLRVIVVGLLCGFLTGAPLGSVVHAATDPVDLTDAELANMGSLNDMFGDWEQVDYATAAGNALTDAAFTADVSVQTPDGDTTELSGVSSSILKETSVNAVTAPLFNAVVTKGGTHYGYSSEEGQTSAFFWVDGTSTDAEIAKGAAGSGLAINRFGLTSSTMLSVAISAVKIYRDVANARIAKVMTLTSNKEQWEITDLATLNPMSGSVAHKIFYKYLSGATKSNFYLGTREDLAVRDLNGTGNRALDRLQVSADGNGGAFITGNFDETKDNQQNVIPQQDYLTLYSDPVTNTTVYGSKYSPSQIGGGGTGGGLIDATGKSFGTALIGKGQAEQTDLFDSTVVYLSDKIATMSPGDVYTMEYVERLSDSSEATVEYRDADTNALITSQVDTGKIDEGISLQSTADYMKANAKAFGDYVVIVSDGVPADVNSKTFTAMPKKWVVKLRKLAHYTPDNNPDGLPLTATLKVQTKYTGQGVSETAALPSLKLYRYATEKLGGGVDYSDWTTSEDEANAHGTVTKAAPSVAALTQAQIDQYLPKQSVGAVTQLDLTAQPAVTGATANAVVDGDNGLADWLRTGGDATLQRTVTYKVSTVGPIVPDDPSDPYYQMTHKTLTVQVPIDDSGLSPADQAAVALGAAGTQKLHYTREVTYDVAENKVLALGPWQVDKDYTDIKLKALPGYDVLPGATITAESLTTGVGGTVPAATKCDSLAAVMTAYLADDNGGVTAANAEPQANYDGTATVQASYYMQVTYPLAGSRTSLWVGLLTTALVLIAGVALLVRGRRHA